MTILDRYSKEEMQEIANRSFNLTEFCLNLGYATKSGPLFDIIRKKILELDIDTDHFLSRQRTITKRTPENVFIENATCAQSTLRKFYLKETSIVYQCSLCGQPPIWKGEELTLILDHIDGNNKNNVLTNLRWVCPNCNIQLKTHGGKNAKRIRDQYNIKHHNYCKTCGKEEVTNPNNNCLKCANLKSRIVKDRPDRDTLKILIRTTPFTTIGRQYNVSDNAIRKWCKSENLPFKSSEIKNYSDAEWDLI